MLFLNFSSELIDAFKSKYNDVAVLYKGKGLGFLLGDLEASQGAFQVVIYFFRLYYCVGIFNLTYDLTSWSSFWFGMSSILG